MLKPFRAAALAVVFAWIPFLVVAAGCWGAPSAAAAASTRFAAILVDAESGEVMYARRPDAVLRPASLAKVMTLYLTFEALSEGRLEMSDRIVVSPYAASRPPSKIGLRPGSSLTVEEAVNLLIVKSANDVAAALGEKLAGSEANFAARMTARAKQLGMKHTHFANASGLPHRRQVSTARDLALLGRAVLRDHPEYYELFDQQRTTFRGRVIRGRNRLLQMPGVDGMKTGYTRAAGFNLMTSAEIDDRRVVAVVLGGSTSAARDTYMRGLLEAGFQSLQSEARDRSITVAPLLHETPPDRSQVRNEIAQGSSERDEPQPPSNSGWLVQVGAFQSRGRGEDMIADLAKRYPGRFGSAEREVRSAGALHLARFLGFSAEEAQVTCRFLRRKGGDCLVMRSATSS
jgi:D-alanyl-D-alanine carboxypeptidase